MLNNDLSDGMKEKVEKIIKNINKKKETTTAIANIEMEFTSPKFPDLKVYLCREIASITIKQDFVLNITDKITAELMMERDPYIGMMYMRKNMDCNLTITYTHPDFVVDDEEYKTPPAFVGKFKCIVIRFEDLFKKLSTEQLIPEKRRENDHDRRTYSMSIELIDEMVYKARKENLYFTGRDTNMKDMLRYCINYFGFKYAYFCEPDNKRKYTNFVIPPSYGVEEIMSYLQNAPSLGIYNDGLISYIVNGVWYVYPRYGEPVNKFVTKVYCLGGNKYAGMNRMDWDENETSDSGDDDSSKSSSNSGNNSSGGNSNSGGGSNSNGGSSTNPSGNSSTQTASQNSTPAVAQGSSSCGGSSSGYDPTTDPKSEEFNLFSLAEKDPEAARKYMDENDIVPSCSLNMTLNESSGSTCMGNSMSGNSSGNIKNNSSSITDQASSDGGGGGGGGGSADKIHSGPGPGSLIRKKKPVHIISPSMMKEQMFINKGTENLPTSYIAQMSDLVIDATRILVNDEKSKLDHRTHDPTVVPPDVMDMENFIRIKHIKSKDNIFRICSEVRSMQTRILTFQWNNARPWTFLPATVVYVYYDDHSKIDEAIGIAEKVVYSITRDKDNSTLFPRFICTADVEVNASVRGEKLTQSKR